MINNGTCVQQFDDGTERIEGTVVVTFNNTSLDPVHNRGVIFFRGVERRPVLVPRPVGFRKPKHVPPMVKF